MLVYYLRKDMDEYLKYERMFVFDPDHTIQPYETKMSIEAINFKWMILKVRMIFKSKGILPCSDFIEGATPKENELYISELALLKHLTIVISERRILAPSMN